MIRLGEIDCSALVFLVGINRYIVLGRNEMSDADFYKRYGTGNRIVNRGKGINLDGRADSFHLLFLKDNPDAGLWVVRASHPKFAIALFARDVPLVDHPNPIYERIGKLRSSMRNTWYDPENIAVHEIKLALVEIDHDGTPA